MHIIHTRGHTSLTVIVAHRAGHITASTLAVYDNKNPFVRSRAAAKLNITITAVYHTGNSQWESDMQNICVISTNKI